MTESDRRALARLGGGAPSRRASTDDLQGLLLQVVFALLMVFMSIIFSCSMMFTGALGNIGSTTYQSTPEDMTEVEAAYCDMETALQEKIDKYFSGLE